VFGVVGAVLIGAGIVLVLAHNWDDLSRPVRAAIAFGLLLAAQGLVAWVRHRRSDSIAWIEGANTILTLAVVATIALVAQTYHMGGTLADLLFVWVVLLIPLPYLTGSRVVAAATWIVAAWSTLATPWWSHDDVAWVHWWVPALATLPFLVRLLHRHAGDPRTAVVGWAAAGSVFAVLARGIDDRPDPSWIPAMTALFAAYLVLGRGVERSGVSRWSWILRPWTTGGIAGLGVLVFLLSFRSSWFWLEEVDRAAWFDTAGIVGAVAVAGIVALAARGAFDAFRERHHAIALLLLTPGWATVGVVTGLFEWHALGTRFPVIPNLVAIAIGILGCMEGVRRGTFGPANGGLILIAAVAFARFFDSDVPFVVRGIGFIVVGVGFLYVNVRLVRARRSRS
jgi:hypothetical protein